jgi:ATP-dependent Clp protease adaptor protein ClpS
MPKMETEEVGGASENTGNGATLAETAEPSTPAKTATATRPRTSPPRVDKLPPFKVLLHNDDHSDMLDVVKAIVELTPLRKELAVQRTLEAHTQGVSLLLVTHKERAELYREQFHTKRLMVSIEAGA